MWLQYTLHDGTGPHLLLEHGMLSSPSQWLLNLPNLGEFCRPVAVSLYGHGGAPTPDDPECYRPSQYGVAIENLRSQLGIARWFVCGYSLGAALTIRYAIESSDACLGHIFTNSLSAFAAPETVAQWRKSSETSANSIRKLGIQGLP